MIVIDMDMPKSCCECPICHPKGKDEPWNYACFQGMMDINLDEWDEKRHSDCPIKCDIEDIDREIRKSRREPIDDELDESVNYGLNKALEIIVKHIGGKA